jgi:hypothetical protein
MTNDTITTIESPSDFQDTPSGLQQLWKSELESSKKEVTEFHRRGEKVVKVYLDNRTLTDKDDRNFNLFAANTDILKAAMFSRIPKPDVSRRHMAFDDDVSRVAALILERVLSYELENDSTFHSNSRNIIEDRLLPGLGVAWVRYDTVREDVEVQVSDDYLENTEDELAEQGELPTETIISDESTPIDYVHWKDFFWSPARTWGEVRWVARRVFMSKDELVDRFGDETASLISLSEQETPSSSNINPQNNLLQQGEVFEIWDKTSRKVYWVSLSSSEVLDEKEDPLTLPGFFPCPKPLIANSTSSNMMPLPDYKLVEDQYSELNRLNNRISSLVEACKVAGVYDSKTKALGNLLDDGRENVLIPVDNWAGFAQNNGLQGAMAFLPIEQIANVLVVLQKARDVVKAQIYELTGISDVIRGNTNPYETASAQNLKTQYASLRLNNMQHEVAMFFSELMQMKAHLMVKFYDPQRLMERCGTLSAADMQFVVPAIQLLQNEALSHFRISVSVDSLQSPNFDAEKQLRTEALHAISGFLEKAVPAAQQNPAMGPMLISMLKWCVAGYRASKDLEGILDAGLAQMQADQTQKANQPKPPSPAEQELQLKMQKQQQDFQLAQARLQLDASTAQNSFALEQQKLQLKAEEISLEKAKLQINTQMTAVANQTEATLQNRALDIKATHSQMQHFNNAQAMDHDLSKHALDSEMEARSQLTDVTAGDVVNRNAPSNPLVGA